MEPASNLGPVPRDHPLPLRAGPVGRWLWPTVAVGGFLLVTGFAFAHDDPQPGLSVRGLLTIVLAAAVVVLLTIRRTGGSGPLTRALFEYAVVFLLAVLVATTGVDIDQALQVASSPAPRPTSGPRWSSPSTGSGTGWANGGVRPRGDRSPSPLLIRHHPAPALSPSTRRPL